MKASAGLISRIVVAVASPLDRALRESERLMAPQLDAGCSVSALRSGAEAAGHPLAKK